LSESSQPAAEDAVHALAFHHLLVGPGQIRRKHHERERSVAPMPPCDPASSSNAAASRLLECVGAAHMVGSVLVERSERILAFHTPPVEAVRAARPDSERPVGFRS
jgi:hypothetical protein